MARHWKQPNLWTASIWGSLLFLSLLSCAAASATGFFHNNHRQRVAEIQQHLAQVNKPAVKSIQSDDGDIIDCVSRTQQPAFGHPALRNHSLQTAPPVAPRTTATDLHRNETGPSSSIPPQLWHQSGRCPPGTVPIRRTSVKDVLRAGTVKHYMMKKPHRSFTKDQQFQQQQQQQQASQQGSDHEHAIGFLRDGVFFGTQALLNVWSPKIQIPTEFSLSQIWVLAGSFDNDLNSIEAGWQVSPQMYGDGNPRFFIYWTADSYRETGCYNLLCSGFVQTSSDIAIGATIMPLSIIGGAQYEIRILIWKDPGQGNWWMRYGDSHLVGYWPAALFTHLSASASMLEWGGEVVNSESAGHHTTTAMGSGQFPEKGFAQASYVRNIKYVDGKNVLRDAAGLGTLAEHPTCYNIQTGMNRKWGAYFYYGGPGWNPNCP